MIFCLSDCVFVWQAGGPEIIFYFVWPYKHLMCSEVSTQHMYIEVSIQYMYTGPPIEYTINNESRLTIMVGHKTFSKA